MYYPDLDRRFGLKHRTITHSLAMMLTWLIPPLGLGVTLHILIDLLTPMGCKLTNDWYILLGAPLKTGVHDTILSILLIGGLML